MTLRELNLIFDRFQPTPYNADDLNRVGNAVLYVGSILSEAGYFIGFKEGEVKTDWAVGDFPTGAQLDKYLDNVQRLQDSYVTSVPISLPLDIRIATYVDLNAIEHLLSNINNCVLNMQSLYQYSGDCICGDAIVFPHLVMYDEKAVKRYLGQFYSGGLRVYK